LNVIRKKILRLLLFAIHSHLRRGSGFTLFYDLLDLRFLTENHIRHTTSMVSEFYTKHSITEETQFKLMNSTLQRQNAENSKQIFPEKEYRGLSPNFHIRVSVNELYIPTMDLPDLLEEICRLILGIYKSLKDT
jgi:hypothetical protein